MMRYILTSHDLEPNIFPPGLPTRSISTYYNCYQRQTEISKGCVKCTIKVTTNKYGKLLPTRCRQVNGGKTRIHFKRVRLTGAERRKTVTTVTREKIWININREKL